ncbi:hypothetical protein C8R44DRAFT_339418 [Mycena epipterygia]|nr:hypothetical protein C8R44DRAFT_339418 [Mycena epipterygia]
MPRAASSSPKKAKPSPTKAKPTSPGIKQLRKEWKESLQPWVPQRGFTHPSGTTTVPKSDAKKWFKLDDDDIATLPCEIHRRPPYKAALLYDYDQLMALAQRKCAELNKPLEVNGVVYQNYTGLSSTGGVSIVSLKNPPKLEAWEEHMLNPNPPPLKIEDYTCPPQAVKPDPEEITWTPDKISGPVTVEDACRLYCITPENIQDLSQHSKWIDLATVAKRAVALHGGFYAHEELLRLRRDNEEEMLTRTIPEAYERKSAFRFSPMILQQWKYLNKDAALYDALYAGMSKPPQHPVAVLYPISYFCNDDYGSDWQWAPYWGDF